MNFHYFKSNWYIKHFFLNGLAVLLLQCSSVDLATLRSGLAEKSMPQHPPSTWQQKKEMRAAWVVSFRQLVSREKVDKVVKWAEQSGVNTLFVQIRAHGDAYYRSRIVPRSEKLDSQPVSFDPFAYLLKKLRGKNIRVHAYLNLGIIWRAEQPPKSTRHIFHAHPEWILMDSEGKPAYPSKVKAPITLEENYYWANYHSTAFRRHMLAVCREIMQNYNITGFHFDFVRYPGRMGKGVPFIGLNPDSVQEFRKRYGVEPAEYTRQWDHWRSEQITQTLSYLSKNLKRKNANIQISVAALAASDLALGRVFTDYRKWLEEWAIDFAVLMSYFSDYNEIKRSILSATEVASPDRIVAGYILDQSPERVSRAIELSRDFGLKGFALFSLDSVVMQEPDQYLVRLYRYAMAPVDDNRYSLRSPYWTRLGIINNESPELNARMFSRNARTLLVIYYRNIKKLYIRVGDKKLPTIIPSASPSKLDISSLVRSENRKTIADHDFRVIIEVDAESDFRAEVFTVDYYKE